MIRSMRSLAVRRGRAHEAVQWAKEAAAYLDTLRPGQPPVQVFTEVLGASGTVHWSSDWEDLAAVERFAAQLQADERWQALLGRSVDLFVEGTLRDRALRSV